MRLGKKTKAKPSKKPKKEGAEVIELHPLLRLAKEAVADFEKLKNEFLTEEELWQQEHAAAQEALARLQDLKDRVNTARDTAKHHVKEAGQTVGDFKFQAKKRSSFYDGSKLLQHLLTLEAEELKTILTTLVERGVITALSMDKEASKVVHQRSTDLPLVGAVGQAFDEGGQDLPPSVSVPKF